MKTRLEISGGLCGVLVLLGQIVGGPASFAEVEGWEWAKLPFEEWREGPGITGEALGLRSWLAERGVEFNGAYTWDVFGNVVGGVKRGAVYSGLLDFGADADLNQLVGWPGASVSTTWLWLSGRDASEDLVGNFLTISNIAGFNTLRMLELWIEQTLWDPVLSLRVGQMAADSEFAISDFGSLFLNGTFGWPALIYKNLPEGGPGYPMGALGVRLSLEPRPWVTFLGAVYQGNVFAQEVNRHGFRWRLDGRTGFTFLAESQFRWYQEEEATGLPGHVKAGAWFQTGRGADALADSTSSGSAGFYWIVEQMVYQESASRAEGFSSKTSAGGQSAKSLPSGKAVGFNDQGLNFFARVGFAPSDRSSVDFYWDAGLTYRGLIPSRDQDIAGLAIGYAQVSRGARAELREEGWQPAGAEMVLEATYQMELTRWLTLQPDLQWIIQPNASRSIGNALLLGFRGSVTF